MSRALAAALLTLAVLCAPGAPAATAPAREPDAATRLLGLDAGSDPGGPGAWVRLETDGPLARVETSVLGEPSRLIVELPGLTTDLAERRIPLDSPHARQVRLSADAAGLRISIEAGGATAPFDGRRVVPDATGLRIALGPAPTPARPIDIRRPAPAAPAPDPPSAPAARRPAPLYTSAPEAPKAPAERSAVTLPQLARPPAPDLAPAEAAAPEGSIELRFRSTEIGEVIRTIASATGVPHVADEGLTLRGPVTITGSVRVTPREALELLDAALLLKGFAAFPAPGGVRKILHLSSAGSAAPWRPGGPGDGEAPVATLVRLEAARARDVHGALRPLAGTSTLLLAYPPTNSLILAGSESRVRRLLGLVQALDRDAFEGVTVRRLRHRGAREVAHLLDATFGESTGGAVCGR